MTRKGNGTMVEKLKSETWIGWLAALAVMAVTGTFSIVVFAYSNFETKEHAGETRVLLKEIADKLDALGGFAPGPFRRPTGR